MESTRVWGVRGGGSISLEFLTSVLDGGVWSASRPDRFIPEEIAQVPTE
jgi:hypothetical protein